MNRRKFLRIFGISTVVVPVSAVSAPVLAKAMGETRLDRVPKIPLPNGEPPIWTIRRDLYLSSEKAWVKCETILAMYNRGLINKEDVFRSLNAIKQRKNKI